MDRPRAQRGHTQGGRNAPSTPAHLRQCGRELALFVALGGTSYVAFTGGPFDESCEVGWQPVGSPGVSLRSYHADVADGVKTALPVSAAFTTTGPTDVYVDCLSVTNESAIANVTKVATLH
jgi:hypothetical protein